MKVLSLKTALLLALASAKRVSELCACSIATDCMSFGIDNSSVMLRPNPAFRPKVVTPSYRSRCLLIRAFCPPPFESEDQEAMHSLSAQ